MPDHTMTCKCPECRGQQAEPTWRQLLMVALMVAAGLILSLWG